MPTIKHISPPGVSPWPHQMTPLLFFGDPRILSLGLWKGIGAILFSPPLCRLGRGRGGPMGGPKGPPGPGGPLPAFSAVWCPDPRGRGKGPPFTRGACFSGEKGKRGPPGGGPPVGLCPKGMRARPPGARGRPPSPDRVIQASAPGAKKKPGPPGGRPPKVGGFFLFKKKGPPGRPGHPGPKMLFDGLPRLFGRGLFFPLTPLCKFLNQGV